MADRTTPPEAYPRRQDITGLVLAGGAGRRMGGEKGLVLFDGEPLAAWALRRLAPQVGTLAVNADAGLPGYAALGVPVWPDTIAGRPGPLAGLLAGLQRSATPWLATVPCDSPHFPADLVARLAAAAAASGSRAAIASAAGADGVLRAQPVYCLVHASLCDDLAAYLTRGGRAAGAWAERCGAVQVAFNRPGDAVDAFRSANTPHELEALRPSGAIQSMPRSV